MDPGRYRKLQEAWVSGNKGTTAEEILILVSSFPLAVLINCCFQSSSFVSNFVILVLTTVLSVTDFWKDVRLLPYFLVFLAICAYITAPRVFSYSFESSSISPITHFRAYTNLVTAICILAVDFTIFPRRYAKCETFGFGFMDLGVGFFVVCNGLVFKSHKIYKEFKAALLFLFLGFIRLLSTQSVDYHQHVSEYGVHWNFFFTLAACRLLGLLLETLITKDVFCLFIITSFYHQMSLQSGWQKYVLNSSPRDNFLSANKEGIVSSTGFLALFYASSAVGRIFSSSFSQSRLIILWKLFLVCCVSWISTLALAETGGISRQLCNWGYIAWVMAMSSTLLFLLTVVDVFLYARGRHRISPLLDSINRNGLFYFLLANLLTGLINMNVQTLLLSESQSYLVLFCYCLFLNYIIYVFYKKNIVVKFWYFFLYYSCQNVQVIFFRFSRQTLTKTLSNSFYYSGT